LAERPRRLDREDRFFDLARERRVVTEEARFDQLLRDRRAALRNASARAVDLDRANDATDVDARAGPKGLVLDRDRRVLHPFGNGIDRDQIASFIRERVEEVLPASVVDVSGERHRHRGEVARGGKIRGEVAERRGRGDADEREAGEEDGREDARERADRPHRADAARKATAAAAGAACRARVALYRANSPFSSVTACFVWSNIVVSSRFAASSRSTALTASVNSRRSSASGTSGRASQPTTAATAATIAATR